MKHAHILILLLFFLVGCAPGNSGSIPDEPEPTPIVTALSPLEMTQGLYSAALRDSDCAGLYTMGEDLLLLRSTEEGTLLTRLCTDTLTVQATAAVNAEFSKWAFSMQLSREGLCYFDSDARQIVVLDAELRPQRRIDAPSELTGVPFLSRDGKTLYYCTDSGIRAMDLETGISRVLKQTRQQNMTLSALLLGDSVLRCDYTDPSLGARSMFVSASTGQTLSEQSQALQLLTANHMFYASFENGPAPSLVFGSSDTGPKLLLPPNREAKYSFLPQPHGLLAVTNREKRVLLEYYSLDKGICGGSLTLEETLSPLFFTATSQGQIFFIARNTVSGQSFLCRWEPEQVSGEGITVTDYYPPESPDLAGLDRCQNFARELGAKHGIEILIWEDAVRNSPREYRLEPEYQPHLIMEELKLLSDLLGKFPDGFLSTLSRNPAGIRICLVRSIHDSTVNQENKSVHSLGFWKENDAYLVIPLGSGQEVLYHGLYTFIDIRLLSESSACDQWEQYNPGDFEYDYDYTANQSRDGSLYLQDHSRSFIDTFAMSFPREDRAGIWKYALLPGQEAIFRAPILQQKLSMLCQGVREAFDLETYPTPLPWEQYLQQPLTPEA